MILEIGRLRGITEERTKNGGVVYTVSLEVVREAWDKTAQARVPSVVAIPFKAFGKNAAEWLGIPPGTLVRVDGRIDVNEWHGRVFANVIAESVVSLGDARTPNAHIAGAQAQPSQAIEESGDIPF